jgi:hypothetical protein
VKYASAVCACLLINPMPHIATASAFELYEKLTLRCITSCVQMSRVSCILEGVFMYDICVKIAYV